MRGTDRREFLKENKGTYTTVTVFNTVLVDVLVTREVSSVVTVSLSVNESTIETVIVGVTVLDIVSMH